MSKFYGKEFNGIIIMVSVGVESCKMVFLVRYIYSLPQTLAA